MSDKSFSGHAYQQAGVDNIRGDRAKDRIGELVRTTYTPGVVGGYGHFGSMFRAPAGDSQILVSSADSVGTKVLLAVLAGRHDSIGVDLVNHSVNDILCCGARPLFFLDYFATSSLDESVLADLVEGMAEACREAGCALIGGETAQLPGIYRESTYDLAGFIVGSVDEKRIIDGSAIREGDVIIGLPSNGLHTNGYSLARAALGLTGDADAVRVILDARSLDLGEPLSDALLRPHTSYLPAVAPLLDNDAISGLAHVTGGGIVGNLSRIVPHDCTAIVDASRWTPPPVFTLIQRSGNVSTHEMFDVFNMGIGFIIVARAEAALMIEGSVEGAITIGEIAGAEPGMERVQLKGLAGA